MGSWRSSLCIQNIEIFPCWHEATTACTFRHDSNSGGIIIDRQPIQKLIWSVYDPSSMTRRRENQELNTAAFFRTLQSLFSKFSHWQCPFPPVCALCMHGFTHNFRLPQGSSLPCLLPCPSKLDWSITYLGLGIFEHGFGWNVGGFAFYLFFARPHLEVPLPTLLDFRTKKGVKGLCCRIVISSLNTRNATNAKHSNVQCCWGNLFKSGGNPA